MVALSCPICLQAVSRTTETSCGHAFHSRCITKWLEKNDTCPMCRHVFCPTEVYHLSGATVYSGCAAHRRRLREDSENFARRRFSRRVDVSFHYPGARLVSAHAALWFVVAVESSPHNWMPQVWRNFYRNRPSVQTREALRLSQEEGVHTIIHANGGKAPRRLYHCRICNGLVCSDFQLMATHYSLQHRVIIVNDN